MTLVLALRCRDGIVLAADGQATADATGQPTRLPARKLFDVGGCIAWGAAGSAGLQQTLADALAEHEQELVAAAGSQLRRRLAELVVPIQQRALEQFVPHPGAPVPDMACIFAWCDGGGARILSIPRTGGDHQFHAGHAAVGTGDVFADFALTAMAHLEPARLSLRQATLIAFKVVADAIAAAALYLGPPIRIYAVTSAGASELPAAELEGSVAGSVEAWKAREREAFAAGCIAPYKYR